MKESWFKKYAPLTGTVFVVMIIISIAIYNLYEYLPSAESLVEFLNKNSARVSAAGYLGAVAGFFLIWFSGSMRSALLIKEGGTGELSTIAFGGGIAAGVFMIAAFTMMSVSGQRAGTEGGISPAQAIVLYDLQAQVMGQMFAVGMAVMIAAAGFVSLRAQIFPTWFGWLSVLTAIGLLSPFNYLVLYFAILWILVVSIWLFLRLASREVPQSVGSSQMS